MNIRILGAHTAVSARTDYTSILIDDVLAVDAGCLSTQLSFEAQKKLKAILITHAHFDHVRDIPSIGWNMGKMKASLDIYAAAPVRDALLTYLENLENTAALDHTKNPPGNPALRIHIIESLKKVNVNGYEVLPVSVTHSVPANGYQVTSPDGKKVFFTADTGPGLADVWRQIHPDLLVSELTFPNKDNEPAHNFGHLTPALLQQELESFKSIHHYLPKIVLIHLSPFAENEIKKEIHAVEKALKLKIMIAHEGTKIKV